MLDWMLLPFKRYAEFSGRSRRMEYWSFMIIFGVLSVITLLIDAEMFAETTGHAPEAMYEAMAAGIYSPPITGLMSLVFLAPYLSICSRRFHDIGQSGWIAITCIIPIVAIIIGFPAGNKGANKYGPDPLEGAG